MPKIIDNARAQILDTARRHAMEKAYSGLSMREVAKESGVSVGTLYNYFENKETLFATFMLDDWLQIIEEIKPVCENASDPSVAFRCIHDGLLKFHDMYQPLFNSHSAEQIYNNSVHRYHTILSGQLAELLKPVAARASEGDCAFLAEFAAESLLTWTLRGRSFEAIDAILRRLF